MNSIRAESLGEGGEGGREDGGTSGRASTIAVFGNLVKQIIANTAARSILRANTFDGGTLMN